jgi:hypothetical protein
MMTPSRTLVVLCLALLALTCSEPAPPPDTSVENAALGIKLTSLPEGLVLAINQGETLELKPADEGTAGRVWFVARPEQEGVGVNLVAAVQGHQAEVEAMPDGSYKGAQELQGDIGTAFYSRGRFSENGLEVEETILFLIHPSANRLLEIHYRYPAGTDSAARVEQLIGVLGELE